MSNADRKPLTLVKRTERRKTIRKPVTPPTPEPVQLSFDFDAPVQLSLNLVIPQ